MIRFVLGLAFVVGLVWFFATHWPSSAPDPRSATPPPVQTIQQQCAADSDHTLISVHPDKTIEVYQC